MCRPKPKKLKRKRLYEEIFSDQYRTKSPGCPDRHSIVGSSEVPMIVLTTAQAMQTYALEQKRAGKRLGFVPTMGYLHAGHLSLVSEAKKHNDLVVVSIFVNPTQFGPQEDLAKYPRDIERDKQLLISVDTDVLFFPEVTEIYPADGSVKVFQADQTLTSIACGAKRLGHFDGVVTVVSRLFDLVQPAAAYFGLKDYQQFLVIKKMTEAKHYPIQIVGCPIVREKDGLAMSSRNTYLSPAEREDALVLSCALAMAKQLAQQGLSLPDIKKAMLDAIAEIASARIDYVEILDAETLQPVELYAAGQVIALLAVYIGKTRLIDNMVL